MKTFIITIIVLFIASFASFSIYENTCGPNGIGSGLLQSGNIYCGILGILSIPADIIFD